jgi:hypothetical protein
MEITVRGLSCPSTEILWAKEVTFKTKKGFVVIYEDEKGDLVADRVLGTYPVEIIGTQDYNILCYSSRRAPEIE